MTWIMPDDWVDDFDPVMANWAPHIGPVREIFPGVIERGWQDGLRQRDFFTRVSGDKTETLVVEWEIPWRAVMAIILNGAVIEDMPESKKEFDTFWKIRTEE